MNNIWNVLIKVKMLFWGIKVENVREMNLVKWRDHVGNVADHESFSRSEMENSCRTDSGVRASKHQILHHIQNASKLEDQK